MPTAMPVDERTSAIASVAHPIAGADEAREQVDRILASNTFHASDVLRRLLRFLADKTFAGAADELKEYSVGLDALGKPATYDPRQDAAVRLHASRLRQKLDDYYRNEGKADTLIVELPKGRFKIAWRPRAIETAPVATDFAARSGDSAARGSAAGNRAPGDRQLAKSCDCFDGDSPHLRVRDRMVRSPRVAHAGSGSHERFDARTGRALASLPVT